MNRSTLLLIAISGLMCSAAIAQLGSSLQAGGMAVPRVGHTATLLPNGKVLITGGNNGTPSTSAELFDPSTNRFALTTPMNTARAYHAAVLLRSGLVLIAGGVTLGDGNVHVCTKTAELYDPATGLFRLTYGQTINATSRRDMILLHDGKVLICSGTTYADLTSSFGFQPSEIFDPDTETFSPAGSMQVQRFYPATTLLSDGRVLVTGGYTPDNGVTTSAELYDPTTRQFSTVGSMAVRRQNHVSALLPSGTVLVAGGENTNVAAPAELFDPSSGKFSTTGSMTQARSYRPTATTLANGQVAVIGGGISPMIEVYDPASGAFRSGGALIVNRYLSTATLLQNGAVLSAGGEPTEAEGTAEVFTPSSPSGLAVSRVVPAVISAAGAQGSFFSTVLEIHNPSGNPISGMLAFRPQANPLSTSTLSFSIDAGNTRIYPDLLTAMGVTGFGTLDVLTEVGNAVPQIAAHVFNLSSDGATTGFVESGLRASDALQAGTTATLFGPYDAARFRFNIGVRGLGAGATVQFVAVDSHGSVIGRVTKQYDPNWFEQVSVQGLFGFDSPNGMTVSVTVMTGSAFIYGAITDNLSNDPAMQVAEKPF